MKISKENRSIEYIERAFGGTGYIAKEPLIGSELLGSHCGLFANVSLKPNCELGHHEHHGEAEVYYIITGTGMYDDNGIHQEARPGDVFYCPDGTGHGIKNTGTEELVFVALILKS